MAGVLAPGLAGRPVTPFDDPLTASAYSPRNSKHALRRSGAYPHADECHRTDGIVVMKFGGTSVAGTEELKRAARRIVTARDAGHDVVAVLSARGKTTDRLLEA